MSNTPSTSSRTRLVTVLAVVVAVGLAALIAVLAGGSSSTPAEITPGTSGPVATGAALPQLPDQGPDPAVGMKLPEISGRDYNGAPVRFDTGAQVIVVAAHWCPHCNRELPKIMAWRASGDLPDVEYNVVSTAVREGSDNYPPGEWLEKTMRWDGAVLADDDNSSIAQALGVSGFPFLIVVDETGTVRARLAGEQDLSAVLAAMRTAGLAD